MKRHITQTVFDSPDGPPGNCLQAAVASFLGLPLEEVPHFVLHPNWAHRLRMFAESQGYQLDVVPVRERNLCRGIAVGPTVRGTHHAVVIEDGKQVWDPHPSRLGLTSVEYVFTLTPLSLAQEAS